MKKTHITNVCKRKLAGFIGKMLYYMHYLPLPACKLPSREEAINNLKNAGYDFPPLWKTLPPLSPSSCDLSIVIPIYNGEKFLNHCLSSIINQETNFSYEIICVNDGSTDESPAILKQVKSKYCDRINVYHQENKGLSCARNSGIAIAKGRYIGFLDCDDFVSSDYVEKIMDRAVETNADIVQTAYDLVDEKNIRFKKKPLKEVCVHDSASYDMYLHMNGYAWGGAMKKDLFQNVRYPEGYWWEDMIVKMLFMRLAKTYATIPEMLYHKTSHVDNLGKKCIHRQTMRSIDQYWLPTQLLKYQKEELCLPTNDGQYSNLLEQYSVMLWWRTHNLPNRVLRSLFVLASTDIHQLRYSWIKTNKTSIETENALKGKEYYRWVILSASRFLSGFSS